MNTPETKRDLGLTGQAIDERRVENIEPEKDSQIPFQFPESIVWPEEMIGCCGPMREVFRLINLVAPSLKTVLIRGQKGTGKRLVANTIHNKSLLCYGPFIEVTHTSLETLIGNELSEHDEHVSSNTITSIIGPSKATHNCTIFIDDIGELNLSTQGWMLRAIQGNKFQHISGDNAVPVTIRLIVATNRDLEKDVTNGRFREDFLYRINGFSIRVPPLRERGDDIFLLAHQFIKKYSRLYRKNIEQISKPTMELLASYRWPENVRELKTVIKYAVLIAQGTVIEVHDLPSFFNQGSAGSKEKVPQGTFDHIVATYKKELIINALNSTKGNLKAAAELLHTTPKQILRKIHQYNVDYRSFKETHTLDHHHKNETL